MLPSIRALVHGVRLSRNVTPVCLAEARRSVGVSLV